MAKKKGTRLGVWIIVGLLFLGLIGFGSAGLVAGARTVATVGGKEITTQAYANELQSGVEGYIQQAMTPELFALAEQIGVTDAVFAQVISERVLDHETATLGLSAGDARIRERLVASPRFQGLDGQFDRDGYRFALERDGISERDYETGMREDLSRALLQGAVVRGINAPDAYTDALVAFVGERRAVTYTEITANSLAAPVNTPDDAALDAYFADNAETYMSAEVREITFVWLTPEMLSASITVDEDEVRGVYQDRIAEYVQSERRLVERLVFGDDDAVTAALARVEAGDIDFEGLVTERGLDLAEADMGDVSEADLGDAGAGVFAADPGDVVGPFATPLGPALFRMNAVLQAQETTFDEAREALEAELATARARRTIADAGEQIADLIVGGATLEDLAERTDLVLVSISWTEGRNDGAAAYDEFRAAAASAEVGSFPELMDLEDGGVFALRLDAIVPPAQQSLDDVRDAVIADLMAEQTIERIAALAAEYTRFIAARGDFEDLGLPAVRQPGLLRRGFVAGTPPGFMDMVYTMAAGDILTMPTENGTIIVRLDTITAADPTEETIATERDDIIARANDGMAQDIYTAYTRILQDQTDISIDAGAVEAVHNLFR